ncbi:hypothetical protein [Dactylosporangium sp. NPDC000521]|uniref:hypothetical protein n=1 Tax=Dactylosporangium sp. NPDC000521 TaxID=3363975 RepID=UPI0036B5C98B
MTRSIRPPRPSAESSAIAYALLEVEVAIDVIALIHDVVEDHDDRALVVADIVECWLRLSPKARAEYDSWAPFSGLRWFAGDYTAEVDRASLPAEDAPVSPPFPADTDELCYKGWQRHVADLRSRRRTGAPPAAAWLARFAAPTPPSRCA